MAIQVFISHIQEEAELAARLKTVLTRDFLGMLQVFVSSDTESISAGAVWLDSIKRSLRECRLFLVLCSAESVKRPWINFEAGAAWIRGVPLVPVCHSGYRTNDLPVPLSLHERVQLGEPASLKRLYDTIANILECMPPARSFDDLAAAIGGDKEAGTKRPPNDLARERATRRRLTDALMDARFRWRSLDRLATEALISEEQAADLLRADPEVRFSKGKSGRVIVGLRRRVDGAGKTRSGLKE